MKTQSPDTHPNAEAVLIELMRKLTPAQRMTRVRSLSSTMIELSRRAIKRANPDLSEEELKLKFVAMHYGTELSERLCAYLKNRS